MAIPADRKVDGTKLGLQAASLALQPFDPLAARSSLDEANGPSMQADEGFLIDSLRHGKRIDPTGSFPSRGEAFERCRGADASLAS
jgi:hypothetical protein